MRTDRNRCVEFRSFEIGIASELNGRGATRVYTARPGIHCHYLNWSPDGRFIYFVGGIPPDEMDIWRIPSSGGTAERLTFHNSSVAYPAFTSDGTLLYRATADDGSGPWLYALDVGGATRRVSLGVEQYLSIAASADGRRLVAAVSNPTGGLWSVPLTTAIVNEEAAERVPVPAVTARAPRFLPPVSVDGTQPAFTVHVNVLPVFSLFFVGSSPVRDSLSTRTRARRSSPMGREPGAYGRGSWITLIARHAD